MNVAFFQSEFFWEAVCFVLFVVVIYKPTKKVVCEYLDQYTLDISKRISEAEAIIKEANKVYNYYTKQTKMLDEQVDTNEKDIRKNVEHILESGRHSLNSLIENRYNLHKERLEVYKQSIINQIRIETLTKAAALASLYIRDHYHKQLTQQDLEQTVLSLEKKKIVLH